MSLTSLSLLGRINMGDPIEQENRLRKFAGFFKGYMGVMPLVTAAVAPLLTMMKAIPVFESQKTTLATYTGLLGFLLLAWVFYVRGPFARAMVSPWHPSKPGIPRLYANLLPLLLITGSVACFLAYFRVLDYAIQEANKSIVSGPLLTRKEILENWGQKQAIPGATLLQAYYLGIFLSAEMAFVVMALREYAYGVLKIPEVEVLLGESSKKPP